ncbi:Scr1 family TA system antitoxin-like transcriptional regulator [Streptomyces paludis]|uniref:Scr1 family TA system antitoxin-like transcriptional regulator n=1 Tax=Streptomyces paludis TaxID=2282738 RepID=UPI0038B54379
MARTTSRSPARATRARAALVSNSERISRAEPNTPRVPTPPQYNGAPLSVAARQTTSTTVRRNSGSSKRWTINFTIDDAPSKRCPRPRTNKTLDDAAEHFGFIGYEETSHYIRSLQSTLAAGLLQTPTYARAVINAASDCIDPRRSKGTRHSRDRAPRGTDRRQTAQPVRDPGGGGIATPSGQRRGHGQAA